MLSRFLALSLIALSLAACGTARGPAVPRQPSPLPQEPIPGMPSPIPQTLPQPALPERSYPRSAEDVSGSAVLWLLKQAEQYRAAGEPDQALAALDRARGIEPRNYFIWAALAQTYLEQENFEQAESIAQKSNSMARGNLYVELENWKTINLARLGRGDIDGAAQAQARVDEIERLLAGG